MYKNDIVTRCLQMKFSPKIFILFLILLSSNLYSQNDVLISLNTKDKIDSFLEKRPKKSIDIIEGIESQVWENDNDSGGYEKLTLYNKSSFELYRIFFVSDESDLKIEYKFYYYENSLILAKVWKEFRKKSLVIDFIKQNSYYFNKNCIETSNDNINTKELYEIGMSHLKKHYELKINKEQ